MQLGPGELREFPPTTFAVGPMVLPTAGGAYFRLFPYGLVRAGLRQSVRDAHPGTFHIHPWETDPGQPRLGVDFLTCIPHYGGGTWQKLPLALTNGVGPWPAPEIP